MPADSTVSLGEGAWLKSIFNDLQFEYVDPDTLEIVPGIVNYESTSDAPFMRSDLDFDNDIDENDWNIYVAGLSMDLSSGSTAVAYQNGDLDGDFDNDLRDLRLFKSDYDNFQGPGAFEAMISKHAVPEPASLVLLSIVLVGVTLVRSQTKALSVLIAGFVLTLAVNPTQAQLFGLYQFEEDADGTALTAGTCNLGDSFRDSTGRENDAAMFAGTVGEVAGQSGFGNAAQFTNGMGQALLDGSANQTDLNWISVLSPTYGETETLDPHARSLAVSTGTRMHGC